MLAIGKIAAVVTVIRIVYGILLWSCYNACLFINCCILLICLWWRLNIRLGCVEWWAWRSWMMFTLHHPCIFTRSDQYVKQILFYLLWVLRTAKWKQPSLCGMSLHEPLRNIQMMWHNILFWFGEIIWARYCDYAVVCWLNVYSCR